jgi:hypothetical protein
MKVCLVFCDSSRKSYALLIRLYSLSLTMTHIANWMRSILDATDSVYIKEIHALSRIRSMSGRICLEMSSPEPVEYTQGLVTPPRRSSEQGGSLAYRAPHLAGYRLWPRQSKAPPAPVNMEVCVPIQQGRSPSSLSDTPPSGKGGLWLRGSSLARRRKVSVPELRRKATMDNTSREPVLDSRKFDIRALLDID